MAGPLLSQRVRAAILRGAFPTVLLGATWAGLTGVAGCGLARNGELAVAGDADPNVIDPGNPDVGGHKPTGKDGGGDDGSIDPVDGASGGDDANGPDPTTDANPSNCNYSGTWATKLTINVNWVPQGIVGVILAPGTGLIQQWIKSVRVQNGLATTDTAVVCGIGLPDFSGTSFVGGETYGVRFPNSLFDSGDLPSFLLHGALGDSTPNAAFTTSDTAALIGLTLADPTTAAWPATVTTAVDSDMDKSPGVTINAASGPIPGMTMASYSDFPVDIFSARANKLDLVIRQVTRLAGAATDCDHLSGTVAIPRIPNTASGKYAIDSHVIGCNLVAGGTCSSSQINFIDTTQPIFSPTGTTAFSSVRLGGGATCGAVRQALP